MCSAVHTSAEFRGVHLLFFVQGARILWLIVPPLGKGSSWSQWRCDWHLLDSELLLERLGSAMASRSSGLGLVMTCLWWLPTTSMSPDLSLGLLRWSLFELVHVDSGPLAERYELSHVMQVVLNSKQVVLRISKNINIGISLTVPSLSFFPVTQALLLRKPI